LPEDQLNYVRFFHNNFDYYRGINTVSDVPFFIPIHNGLQQRQALSKHFPFEQALIQEKIPFDVIFDDHLKEPQSIKYWYSLIRMPQVMKSLI